MYGTLMPYRSDRPVASNTRPRGCGSGAPDGPTCVYWPGIHRRVGCDLTKHRGIKIHGNYAIDALTTEYGFGGGFSGRRLPSDHRNSLGPVFFSPCTFIHTPTASERKFANRL